MQDAVGIGSLEGDADATCEKKAMIGKTIHAMRENTVMAFRLNWNFVATMSLPPAIQNTAYITMPATPNAVRVGTSRGRCSRWCSRLSPLIQFSTNGQAPSTANSRPSSITAGMKTFIDQVKPRALNSQFGMMRTAPSTKPMYQSGCEPAVTSDGLYGPRPRSG